MAKKPIQQVWNEGQVAKLLTILSQPEMKTATQAEFVAKAIKELGKTASGKPFEKKQIISKARLVRKKIEEAGYVAPEIPREVNESALLTKKKISDLASTLGWKKL